MLWPWLSSSSAREMSCSTADCASVNTNASDIALPGPSMIWPEIQSSGPGPSSRISGRW